MIALSAPSPFDFETIAVDNTIKGLTASKYTASGEVDSVKMGKARQALITVDTAEVRVTLNGTDPVGGTTGHKLAVDDTLILSFEMMTKFKVTRDGGSNAAIQVTYFR